MAKEKNPLKAEHGKDLYTENYETLKKETKDDINGKIPHSWVRRITYCQNIYATVYTV